MKKIVSWTILLALVMTLASCGEPEETSHTITFDHVDVESVEADIDSEIELPFLESDNGFFLGWEDALGTIHEETYSVDGNETLTPVFELFDDVLDLEFDDVENTVTIIEYSGSAPRVKLPHTIDGYIVRTISLHAFAETRPTRVDIPMTVYNVGVRAFSNMPNLEEIHFYGDYLGTVENMMNKDEFTEVIDDNAVCQSTPMDEDPTEDNPWVFEEGCPIAKVTGKSPETTGPDGKIYFSYYIEQPAKYASAPTLHQRFSITPFIGSENLTTITLPDKYSFFDPEIFTGLDNLEAVHVENNPGIYSENGIIYETETDYLAYYPSGLLTEAFSVPESIEHINSMALMGSQVETITLHENLTFEPGAFTYLTGLKTILIEGDHPSLTAVDGVLYNEDQTELILYPAGKEDSEPIIHSNVTSIGPFAFMNQHHIEHVVIPEGVEAILDNAFLFNSSLQSVDIASTVDYIAGGNFVCRECNLETVIIRNDRAVIVAPGANIKITDDLVIYIPDDLIQAYKEDMWWQWYDENFVPLSELEE